MSYGRGEREEDKRYEERVRKLKQDETTRLRQQLEIAVGALREIYVSEWGAATRAEQALAQISELEK